MDQMCKEGVREVILTGGEPFVRRDLDMILRALTVRGIRISRIITNGSLLTASHLELLKELQQNPVFNISFDGAGGMHGFLRRQPQSDENVQKAFRLCRQHGFETASDVTLFRDSIPYLRESIRMLDALGCSLIKVIPLFPLGPDMPALEDQLISPEEFLEAVCDYIPSYFCDHIGASVYLSNYFYAQGYQGGWAVPALVLNTASDPLQVSLCRRDSIIPFLSSEGKLMPCPGMVQMENYTGSFSFVEKDGWEEAQRKGAFSRMLAYTVAEHLKHNEECRKCEWNLSCGGGCRIGAIVWENSFYGKDPYQCVFFRNDGPARIRSAAELGMLNNILREG